MQLKQVLRIWIFLLIPFFSIAQTDKKIKFEIDLSDYVKKSELNEIINSKIDSAFKVVKPTDPIVEKCKAGPTIKQINVLSSSNLQINWYGDRVTRIAWKITDSNNSTKAYGQFDPDGDWSNISFTALANGAYKLYFDGVLCTGTSWLGFNVTSNSPPVDPNPGIPDCPHGPFLKEVYNQTSTGLSALFDASGVTKISWKITLVSDEITLRSGTISPQSNTPSISYDYLPPGDYNLWFTGANCKSVPLSPFKFNIKSEVVIPPVEGPGTPSYGLHLGAFEEKAGGRTYTRSASPKLTLKFNNDGTFSDNTPGLNVGDRTTYEGKNSYYMISYGHFHSNKAYKNLQNVYVPDQVITVRRFDCDPSKIQSYEWFKEKIHGYPKVDGVNRYTSQVSEVTVTIRTDDNPGIPEWLKVSRALNFQPNIPDRAFDKKIFAIESINYLERASDYHAKGVYTSNDFNGPAPNSFRTYKFPRDMAPGAPEFSDDELFHFLRGHINQWGLLPRSVITDEVPENAQGLDPTIYKRMALSYKGALELFQQKFPGTKKRDTNLFGSYGVDQFTGYLSKDAIQMPRASLIEWIGSHDTDYFRSEHYKYRNVNADYYMYNSVRMIPYELLVTNERVKVSTKTMPGGDWESDWIVFGTTLCQSLVKDDSTVVPRVVEENHSGEIIPYKNGDILRYPSGNSMIGEHYDLGFWSTLIGKGIVLWGPGSFGTNQNQINYYTPDGWPTVKGWPIKWRPKGQSNWDDWMPGRNNAPENTKNGLQDNLFATVIDVTMWGRQDALKIVDGYADNIYFASYTSSRKNFTAVPGSSGYNLNGFGPLNLNFVPFKDAYDQQAGIPLITTGPKGRAAVYYNGFLSADEYEDNVTLTFGSITKNIGRVYGRKTVWVILDEPRNFIQKIGDFFRGGPPTKVSDSAQSEVQKE